MTEYLIAFNGEWVPEHTDEELAERGRAVRGLVAEMVAAGVWVFTGGLDDDAPVVRVDASSGTPLFTDGPFVETKEHLGGFTVVDVVDEDAARLWAGRIAAACGWPQEVRRFRRRSAPETGDVGTELLASIDLGPELDGLAGLRLRMRKVTLPPGGVFGPVHDHKGRPGTVYVLQGTITDHRDGTATDYGPGLGWPEDRNTLHWLENQGAVPAVEISVDLVRDEPATNPGTGKATDQATDQATG